MASKKATITDISDKLAERREAERLPMISMMPARMLHAKSEKPLQCRIVDISSTGLSVILGEPVQAKDELVLVTLRGQFKLRVSWCKADNERGYRCGLELTERGQDLAEMFRAFKKSS